MTKDEAHKLLRKAGYVDFEDDKVILDGWFSIEQIKAILFLLENK